MIRFGIGALLLLASAAALSEPETVGGESNRWDQLNVTGSVRGGYFSSSRKLDSEKDLGTAAVWLRSAPKFGKNMSLVAEGWVRNDQSFRGNATTSKLREGHLDASAGDADFRIGKQIIVWGRADEINPTDNITSHDYTLLTPETSDQRLGTTAVKATYHFQEMAVTGIWLPTFKSNVFPLAAAPGITYSKQASSGNQGAIKLERSGGQIDWSLSYFNGFDLNPDMKIGTVGPSGINLILENNRVRVLGADAAAVVGQYGLRAEAAYTWTANDAGANPLIKKPFLYAVAGGDRTFFEHVNVNVQYYLRQVSNYQDPHAIANPVVRSVAIQGAVLSNQLDRFQHGMSVRVADKWLNETLEGEVVGVYSMTRHDYVIKPKLMYGFNDKLKGTVGADIFRGGSETYYGYLRNISSIYGELKYSF